MGLIRTLLALSIVIHHSFPLFGITLLGRDPALRSFYIISGFYMSLILNEKYIGKNGGYMLFITNRFFRIFPTYWLILFLTFAFNFFFLHKNFLNNSFFNIINDITLIIRNDVLQINTNYRQILTLPQAYTLVLELYFYLVAPFIVKKSNKFIFKLSVIALCSHFLVFIILRLGKEPIGDWFFPEVIIYFLFGVISYRIYLLIRERDIPLRLLIGIFTFIIILIIFYSAIPIDYHLTSIFPIKEWSFIFLMMFAVPFIFKLTKRIPFDRLIGELSYPIYLSHLLVISVLLTVFSIKPNQSFSTLLFIITTIIFSFCIYFFFEKPIEGYRQSRLKTKNEKIRIEGLSKRYLSNKKKNT